MEKRYEIGFVGLGAIGSGIASNLLAAGHQLRVVAHRTRGVVELLKSGGAAECESYLRLAESSELIMLCLPNSDTVRTVVEQMASGLASRHIVVDTTTSLPSSSEKLHARLAALGVEFAEAPVAGGAMQAESGELGAMVGASDDVFHRIEPVLRCYCSSVEHFGPVGRASRAKLISNHLVLNMVALVYETFTAAAAVDIDWGKLYRPMLNGAGNSMVLRRIIGNAIEGNYDGYVFSVGNAHKDLEYISQLSKELGGEVELSDTALRLFRRAYEQGFGDRMISQLLHPDVRRKLSSDLLEKN